MCFIAITCAVFNYPVGSHNVFKVNGTGFQNCIKPALSEALISGNDTIVLASPGRKWYICGVGQHCASGGQKLFIVVNPVAMSPGVSPSRSFGAPTQALPATGSISKRDCPCFVSINHGDHTGYFLCHCCLKLFMKFIRVLCRLFQAS